MSNPIRVLILEDRATDAELMLHELRQAGFDPDWQRVDIEPDYLAALETKPDLILADWSLPQFSGLRALQAMKERGLDIPFIIVSGSIGEDVAVEAMRQGADDYLLKDRLVRLEQAVRRALENQRLREQRKQAEEALHNSEKRFRALIENSADAITLLDANGIAIYDSPAAPGMLGYGSKEWIGQNVFKLLHPDDFQKIQNLFQDLKGKPGGRVECTFRLRHNNGSWVWIEAVITNLLDEPSVNAIVGNYRDISERKQAGDALHESEEKYRRLFDNAALSIFQSTPDGKAISVNPAFARMFGYDSPEDAINSIKNVGTDLFADPNRRAEIIRLMEEKPDSKTFENLYRRKDGSTFIGNLNSMPIRDSDDRLVRIEGIIEDITQRKQAEMKLQTLSTRQEAILAAVPDILMEVNNDKVYTWANKAGIEFFGEDVIGKEADLFFEGEQDTYGQVKPLFNGSEDVIYVESWQRRKDGEKRLLAWWCRVLKDSNGDVTGALSSAHDITDRKQAEEALKERTVFLDKLIESSALSTWISDGQGTAIRANPACLEFFGATEDEVIGKYNLFQDVVIEKQGFMPDIKRVFEKGEVASIMLDYDFGAVDHIDVKNATHKFINSIFTPILDGNGKVSNVIVQTINLTEVKKAEDKIITLNAELEQRVEERTKELREAQEQLVRQEKLAVLGQLAGGVGHELRNPLAVINNAVYYLKLVQPDADDKTRQYFGMIEREVRTAEKIITDLLDFARVKSVDREPVVISELVQSVLERFPVPESVTAILKLPATLPPVYADPRQMEQVLGNLVVNACQAMGEGGKLTISAKRQNVLVAIAVKDTGTGISPENMKKLFEPLFTTKLKGIGLGLAVSRKLTEANDGRIEVQSEPGKGSTFTVFLPVYQKGETK